MNCTHISVCHLAPSPCTKAFGWNTTSICPSPYRGMRLPKISRKSTYATSRYPRPSIVSLSGGKGKVEGENEGSPWKALEKAVGNFRKDQSVEDVLRQQIQKQEYYDNGDSGGGGSSGGGGGGFGGRGGESEGDSGFWDEFGQVFMATSAFIFLYIYILEGEDITAITKDLLRLVFTRKKSIRLKRLVEQWNSFIENMREKPEYEDPRWLEREIINTPTCYDHPEKFVWLAKVLKSALDSKGNEDTDDSDHSDDE